MSKEDVSYINGKWRLTSKAKESGDYVYRNGDWHPVSKRQPKITPKTPKTPKKRKKMNCGAFPLGKIKEFCRVATLYLLSGALGVSLAFNVFWYLEKRELEQQNLEMLDAIEQK